MWGFAARLGNKWPFLTLEKVIFEYPFCWMMRYYKELQRLEEMEVKDKKTQMLISARLIGAFFNGGDDNQEFIQQFVDSMKDKTIKKEYTSVEDAIAILGGNYL